MLTKAQKIQRERYNLKGFLTNTVTRSAEFMESQATTATETVQLMEISKIAKDILKGYSCSTKAAQKG